MLADRGTGQGRCWVALSWTNQTGPKLLVELSVTDIVASGLDMDVGKPDTVAEATQMRDHFTSTRLSWVLHPHKPMVQPHLLARNCREPPAFEVVRPQLSVDILNSAVQGRISTQQEAAIHWHGSWRGFHRRHTEHLCMLDQCGVPALFTGAALGWCALFVRICHLDARQAR